MRSLLAIVLAAGEGTRMRSTRPKVLHEVGRLPMVSHAVRAAEAAGADRIAVVVGPGHEAVAAEVACVAPGASVYVQAERLGTAHAVLAARAALEAGADDIVVLYGDTPLVGASTLGRLRGALAGGAAVAIAAMRPTHTHGFGRIVEEGGNVIAIREERDASEAELAIPLCNGGLMALAGGEALKLLDAIGCDNAQKQYYLTDAVEIAVARGLAVRAVEVGVEEVFGVNDRAQLAEAERLFQTRQRNAAMREGATLIAPETVHFAHDTKLGRDVLVEPNVVFGSGVTISDGVTIRAFSHIDGATVASGAIVGPFARLRPGARIGEGAHIGNFVEIKEALIEEGAKINHLSYVGDSRVGARANVGAGTITCNYDGEKKHRTDIGAGAFIGSNSALVAPVTIGDGAYIASGSVITHDVAADSLAFGRARQVEKAGWAKRRKAASPKPKS
jgi:bifunctional UDP-N-acetylglucosamine pyrophosphorylase/glucosamine-1-phosphate N-acetyltransferase